MTLGRLVILLAGCVVALVVGRLLVEMSYRPTYDWDDPDYRRYSPVFARLRKELDRRDIADQDVIDLSSLNDGNWKTACVFGGYTDPLEEMRTFGATISGKDEVHLANARSRGFRIGPVEEFEIMIAYVNLSNHAHFVHFERGIGSWGQHFEKCISKPETQLVLTTP
jgi:hypothetical protein